MNCSNFDALAFRGKGTSDVGFPNDRRAPAWSSPPFGSWQNQVLLLQRLEARAYRNQLGAQELRDFVRREAARVIAESLEDLALEFGDRNGASSGFAGVGIATPGARRMDRTDELKRLL